MDVVVAPSVIIREQERERKEALSSPPLSQNTSSRPDGEWKVEVEGSKRTVLHSI